MEFDPYCLINICLAIIALAFYITGSYRLYRLRSKFLLYLGIALAIDILTATLASLEITPTAQIEGSQEVPWDSVLFMVHVILSMIGITGFVFLFAYLAIVKSSRYSSFIIKWQFLALLPIWITGETIALINAIGKVCCGIRIFDML